MPDEVVYVAQDRAVVPTLVIQHCPPGQDNWTDTAQAVYDERALDMASARADEMSRMWPGWRHRVVRRTP